MGRSCNSIGFFLFLMPKAVVVVKIYVTTIMIDVISAQQL